MDVSINIVHYNTPRLLRQTLLGIQRAAPKLNYEVIVVDNNPKMPVSDQIRKEFPEVKVVVTDYNMGFGQGVDQAFKIAKGKYLLVSNPDISMLPGSLEKLVQYLDQNPKAGIVGSQLKNPDGQIQMSCYRFAEPKTVLYRRLPFVKKFTSAQEHLKEYLMSDWDHSMTRDVDYLLGACMLVRREALEQVGSFDPNFFLYFEEQDLCRRFWKKGWRVVYHPASVMVHYHRRESAEGNFIQQLLNPVTRHQIRSARYYFKKYRYDPHPRY
jgi:GT2 family glycosyltransferase